MASTACYSDIFTFYLIQYKDYVTKYGTYGWWISLCFSSHVCVSLQFVSLHSQKCTKLNATNCVFCMTFEFPAKFSTVQEGKGERSLLSSAYLDLPYNFTLLRAGIRCSEADTHRYRRYTALYRVTSMSRLTFENLCPLRKRNAQVQCLKLTNSFTYLVHVLLWTLSVAQDI
jgi:hypothetical protein